MNWLREREERNYIHDNFKVTWDERDIDEGSHDTILYVHGTRWEAEQHFRDFANSLYGKGMITHSQYKIEVDGFRFLFKYKAKVLRGTLRGYDKRTTLIINRGGL